MQAGLGEVQKLSYSIPWPPADGSSVCRRMLLYLGKGWMP